LRKEKQHSFHIQRKITGGNPASKKCTGEEKSQKSDLSEDNKIKFKSQKINNKLSKPINSKVKLFLDK